MFNKWVLNKSFALSMLLIILLFSLLLFYHRYQREKIMNMPPIKIFKVTEIRPQKMPATYSQPDVSENPIDNSEHPDLDRHPDLDSTDDREDVSVADVDAASQAVLHPLETFLTPVKPVRVSPYGFGPYPEIPSGAPIAPFEAGDSLNMELLTRVLVKKWNEGERFTGGIIENGRVYLAYEDVLYVEYDEEMNPETGETTRYISGALGGGPPITSDQILSGSFPPGAQVVDIDAVGYDPYQVLNLP